MIILSIRRCVFNNISHVFLINYNTQTLKYYSKTDWVNKARLGNLVLLGKETKSHCLLWTSIRLDLSQNWCHFSWEHRLREVKPLAQSGAGSAEELEFELQLPDSKILKDLRCVSGHMKTISVDLSFPCAQVHRAWGYGEDEEGEDYNHDSHDGITGKTYNSELLSKNRYILGDSSKSCLF